MGAPLEIGNFVLHAEVPGIARVCGVESDLVEIEQFDSPANPRCQALWVDPTSVRRCRLGDQTRVFWKDELSGAWTAGRIVGGGPDVYFVRRPDQSLDLRIHESRLRVRWEKPLADPLQVLLAGAQESPMFRDARLPVIKALIEQRATCASASGVISSSVALHSHQVRAAMKVLSDPVQRYLLADEVGLGKTIEAGFVIRQLMLDERDAQVVVVAPDTLRRQWRNELRTKFLIDDLPGTLRISAHETPDKWHDYHGFDLVVVDEAHLLAAVVDPSASPYRELRDLCLSVPRVLLLSATPVLRRETTQLALLHLLDDRLYNWDELEAFRRRLKLRGDLARAVYSLDPGFSFLLPSVLDDVRTILPNDELFEGYADQVLHCLDADGDVAASSSETELAAAVSAVRAHISETYRLHRRVIRQRREAVMGIELDDQGHLTPFDVVGRQRPRLVELKSAEHSLGSEVLGEWHRLIRDGVVNGEIDRDQYGSTLAVLVALSGGPTTDLLEALRYRIAASEGIGLLPSQLTALRNAPPITGESELISKLNDNAERDALSEVVRRLEPAFAQPRTVVFAGAGRIAEELHHALQSTKWAPRVHVHGRHVGSEASEQAVDSWNVDGGVLLCDETAEYGRNLQAANLVIHLRLPASPNDLEQRIGRVDRYGSSQTAMQVVFGDRDPHETLSAAWRQVLLDGYGVFERSLSAVQDLVDMRSTETWASAVELGLDSLMSSIPTLRSEIDEEFKEIERLDALEASFEDADHAGDSFLDLARLETTPEAFERDFLRLVTGPDGFRFGERRNLDGSTTFEHSPRAPLLSPRLLSNLGSVPKHSWSGQFDRLNELRSPGRGVFRLGSPLVEAVSRILSLDDRGRASAIWRFDRTLDVGAFVYFGFTYLIEADVDAVALSGSPGAKHAFRRRADQAFPPITRDIWIRSDRESAESDPRVLGFLEANYSKPRGDVNLDAERSGPLFELFGGEPEFCASAVAAETSARHELKRVTDLRARCEESAERVRRDTRMHLAQSAARSAAGALLVDDDDTDETVRVGSAIAKGIELPRVRLVAVTCLVRSRERWAPNA